VACRDATGFGIRILRVAFKELQPYQSDAERFGGTLGGE
jgi:hypothetical protein